MTLLVVRVLSDNKSIRTDGFERQHELEREGCR